MPARALSSAAAVVLAALAVAGPAAGTLTATTQVAGDVTGSSDAAWPAGPHAVAVEARDGSAIVLHDDGRRTTVAGPSGCRLEGAGGERLVYDCGFSRPESAASPIAHVVTTDLAGNGAVRKAVPMSPDDDSVIRGFVGAGRYWLMLSTSGYHWSRTSYVSWRPGPESAVGPDVDPRKVPDLDAPGLLRPLCRPLRRAPAPDWFNDLDSPLQPATFHRPWGLFTGETTVVLQRCGRSRPTLELPVTSRAISDGRRVAWIAGESRGTVTVRVRRLDRQRVETVRYTPPPGYGHSRLVLTRRRLAVTAWGPGADGSYHLAVGSVVLPARLR